jgi:hypothetical protein
VKSLAPFGADFLSLYGIYFLKKAMKRRKTIPARAVHFPRSFGCCLEAYSFRRGLV